MRYQKSAVFIFLLLIVFSQTFAQKQLSEKFFGLQTGVLMGNLLRLEVTLIP